MEALSSGQAAQSSERQGGIYSALMGAADQEMARQMVPMEDGSIQINAFRVTSVGLIGGEQASYAEWERLGKTLFRLHDSLQIILGDWLVQGERIHGKTYEEIAVLFDRKKKTLYNWKYVMSSVDISLRGENLAFKHYRIVAAMPPEKQAYWLGQASANKWGAGKMQDEIDKDQPPALKEPTILKYSTDVMNKKDVFLARAERINRAFDGRDNPDQEAMREYAKDIKKFIQALCRNFGWDIEEL